jgi:hypothetical protein
MSTRTSIVLVLLLCACPPQKLLTSHSAPKSTSRSEIAYGTPDTSHTAVVSVLMDFEGVFMGECTGTIVQVKNGKGYVLTAAHCCSTPPSYVVMADDYGPTKAQFSTGNVGPPAYPVIAGSVWYDSLYALLDHDFCMLQFAAPPGTPSIPVAMPGQDGLALGVDVEHVGFGLTESNSNNTGRRTAVAPVDLELTDLVLESSQGGPNNIPGTCAGDSGGPALLPASVSQSQQFVVGTTSYGSGGSCQSETLSVSSRVTSETGPGGFITNYLADTPTGTSPPPPPTSCGEVLSDAEDGGCWPTVSECDGGSSCLALIACLDACPDQACQASCWNAAGSGVNAERDLFYFCVCMVHGSELCDLTCADASLSSVVPDGGQELVDGGALCETSATGCSSCMAANCCNEAAACSQDSLCPSCLSITTYLDACQNNPALNALGRCMESQCNGSSDCDLSGYWFSQGSSSGSTSSGSTSNSSGSSGSSSSSSSSNGATSATSTSTGTGTSGSSSTSTTGSTTGQGATGSTSSGSNAHSPSSGCGCHATGSSEFASLALLYVLSLASQRWRRKLMLR